MTTKKKHNMININRKQLLLIAIVPLLICCNSESSSDKVELKVTANTDKVAVSAIIVKPQVFRSQLLSNGKLEAIKKTTIKSQVSGNIKHIAIKEGAYLRSKTKAILLDTVDASFNYESATVAHENAKLEYQNKILGQGYSIDDDNIPKETIKIARLRSGLEESKLALSKSKLQLEKCSVTAPFSGLVANLKVKKFSQVNVGDELFTLIDASRFETHFSLLETEIGRVSIGDSITVTPISSQKSYYGAVTNITPLVDENGMVSIIGVVNNVDGGLLEGLNVKVILEKMTTKAIVVPNEAVLLRQNKRVVFTCINDSVALWNYVTVGERNSTHSTLIGDDNLVKEGDTVIYRNNLHLANETIVDLKITK